MILCYNQEKEVSTTDTMMIAIIVIAVLACSIIIFVILSLFSPRVQGKMMSKQIKSVKHMMDYSKDDLKN